MLEAAPAGVAVLVALMRSNLVVVVVAVREPCYDVIKGGAGPA